MVAIGLASLPLLMGGRVLIIFGYPPSPTELVQLGPAAVLLLGFVVAAVAAAARTKQLGWFGLAWASLIIAIVVMLGLILGLVLPLLASLIAFAVAVLAGFGWLSVMCLGLIRRPTLLLTKN